MPDCVADIRYEEPDLTDDPSKDSVADDPPPDIETDGVDMESPGFTNEAFAASATCLWASDMSIERDPTVCPEETDCPSDMPEAEPENEEYPTETGFE